VLGTGQSGCGLGLAIVREIAQRHGGSVSAKGGGNGVGSVFVLDFPHVKREANE